MVWDAGLLPQLIQHIHDIHGLESRGAVLVRAKEVHGGIHGGEDRRWAGFKAGEKSSRDEGGKQKTAREKKKGGAGVNAAHRDAPWAKGGLGGARRTAASDKND